jgi:hypothetical protein
VQVELRIVQAVAEALDAGVSWDSAVEKVIDSIHNNREKMVRNYGIARL